MPSIIDLNPTKAFLKRKNELKSKLDKFFVRKKTNFFEISEVQEFLDSDDEYILDITLRKIGALGIKSNFTVIKPYSDHISGVVRAAAANAFGLIRDRRAIPFLEKMSNDDNYLVTWESIIALSNIGTKEANPVFIKSLRDPHPTIRMLSARALGENPEVESLVQLVKAAGDINKAVRAAVIEALGKANYFPAFSLFEEAITDSDPEVRTVAILSIANFPQPKILRYFKQSIKDYSDSVRLATIKSLETIGYAESVPIIESVVNDRSATIRQAAIKTLGEIGSFDQMDVIAPFLNDKSPKVRAEAATALGKLGYVESTKMLLNAVKDSNKTVRAAAASALCLINDQFEINLNIASSHFNIHLQNLESGDLLVRENAVRNLCYKGVSFAVNPLLEAAKDSYIEIRRLSIKALALVRDKKSYGTIHKGLADPCLRVKWESVYNLDLYSDMVKLSDISRLFFDPEPSVRLKCAHILEYNKTNEALDTLLKGINDTDVPVRRAIVKAICSYNTPEIVPALRQVLSDKVLEIGCLAALKLGEMNVADGSTLIIESMRSQDLHIRRRALHVANLLNTPIFLRQAIKLASESDFETKLLAMHYISLHAELQFIKNIKTIMSKETNVHILVLGLDALGNIRGNESHVTLEAYANSEVAEIKKHALKNLLRMNISIAQKKEIILQIFKECDEEFRRAILKNINVYLEKNGKEFLQGLIESSPMNIAVLALQMLRYYPGPETQSYLIDIYRKKSDRLSEAAKITLSELGFSSFKLFMLKFF